jgi:hypothetical protein
LVKELVARSQSGKGLRKKTYNDLIQKGWNDIQANPLISLRLRAFAVKETTHFW